MPRGMSYGLLPRAPVRCRCHTTATATAKQHTTETRMEVIIIRRLLGTMIATFLLHSDCICWATSFILAHGSGKNVDHFLHGRVFTPLQPPSSVPVHRPLPAFLARLSVFVALKLLSRYLRYGMNDYLGPVLGSCAGPKVFAVFSSHPFAQLSWFQYYCVINKGVVWPLRQVVREGATVTESKDCTQNYYYLLAQEFLVVLEVSYPGPGHWTGPAFLVTAQVCRFHLVR